MSVTTKPEQPERSEANETLKVPSLKPSERAEAHNKAKRGNLRAAGLHYPLYIQMAAKEIIPLEFQRLGKSELDKWIGSPTRNVVITGPVGTGKTLFLISAASTLASMTRFTPRSEGDNYYSSLWNVRFISAPETLDTLRNQYGQSRVGQDILDGYFVKPRILFLDDFDKVRPTEWALERLWIILNERIVWNRPTCITSNLNLLEIEDKYGEAIASRLASDALLIELDGKDQRVK